MKYSKQKLNYAISRYLKTTWDIKPKNLLNKMERTTMDLILDCQNSKAMFMLVPAHESSLDITKAIVETALVVMDGYKIKYPNIVIDVETN